MKKTIIIILLGVFAFNTHAQVNDSNAKYSWQHHTAIKINLVSYIANFVNIQLEQAISNKTSLNLIYALGFKNNSGEGSQGYSIGLEYRYYSTGSPTKGGVYVAPFLRYRDISFIETRVNTDVNTGNKTTQHIQIPYTNYGVGAVFGYQLALFQKRLLIDGFIGPEYNTKSTKNNPAASVDFINAKDYFDYFMEGTGIRLGTTIGYRF